MPTQIAITSTRNAVDAGRIEPYLRAITTAGGHPEILTPEREPIESVLERCTGLMLTGGGDIDPARYGEPNRSSRNISAARDEMEFMAVEAALARDLPVLAICRGMQLLNVFLGGSLWQDLSSERASEIHHSQEAARAVPTHSVRVARDSRLFSVLECERAETNSMHHQGIKQLAARLVASAWTEDGLVEGAELPATRFALGVQWHPEELTAGHEHARRLFSAFVVACVAQ